MSPGVSTKHWTQIIVYRGLAPRDKVAAARKPDGSPLDHNPIETMSMDTRETPTAQTLTYWVHGGELLNVWLAYYEPNADEFEREEGDWFPADREEMVGNMSTAFEGPPSRRRRRTHEPDGEPDEVGALRPGRARELDGGSRGPGG